MKKILLVCAFMCAMLVSCSKGDNEEKNSSIVKAWRCISSKGRTTDMIINLLWENNVLKFTEDGLYFENGELKGTYYVQNDSVYFNKTTSNAEFNNWFTILGLDNSTLVLYSNDVGLHKEMKYEFKSY